MLDRSNKVSDQSNKVPSQSNKVPDQSRKVHVTEKAWAADKRSETLENVVGRVGRS